MIEMQVAPDGSGSVRITHSIVLKLNDAGQLEIENCGEGKSEFGLLRGAPGKYLRNRQNGNLG